jgi:hypothetical protein
VSRIRIAAVVLAGAALLQAPAAFAQAADPPASRVEAGIGVLWMGTQALGDAAVTETTPTGDARALFHTSSELGGAAGLGAHVGVRLTRRLVAEAEASYLRPPLRIAVSGDAEGAAPVTASEDVQQFTIGLGILCYLPVRRTPRLTPFVTAGGGYLRQLHEAATLVETGRYYQIGAGASFLLVSGRYFHTKGVGARAEARAVVRAKGVAFDGGSNTSPAAGVSMFVRF